MSIKAGSTVVVTDNGIFRKGTVQIGDEGTVIHTHQSKFADGSDYIEYSVEFRQYDLVQMCHAQHIMLKSGSQDISIKSANSGFAVGRHVQITDSKQTGTIVNATIGHTPPVYIIQLDGVPQDGSTPQTMPVPASQLQLIPMPKVGATLTALNPSAAEILDIHNEEDQDSANPDMSLPKQSLRNISLTSSPIATTPLKFRGIKASMKPMPTSYSLPPDVVAKIIANNPFGNIKPSDGYMETKESEPKEEAKKPLSLVDWVDTAPPPSNSFRSAMNKIKDRLKGR